MRKSVVVGIILSVCAVVLPMTTSGASARAASHVGRATGHSRAAAATTHLTSEPSAAATAFIEAAKAKGLPPPVPVTGNAATLSANPSTGLLDGQPITVTGSGFPAKSGADIVECPAGDPNPLDCDVDGAAVVESNGSGSFSSPFTAVRLIEGLESGTTTDCATAACDLTAFDSDLTPVAETTISFADVAIIPSTVSAVPSTGLLNGQRITVSGTNFTPNATAVISECQSGTVGEACGGAALGIRTDGSGSFSTSYRVTRIIEGIAGSVDCAQPPGCEIVASNEDGTQETSTPVSFADVAIIPPVMTATPSTDLEDGQSITVTGHGFGHRDEIGLTECAAGSTDGSECVLQDGLGNVVEVATKGAGRFTATFDVARIITLTDGTIDCSQAPGCVLGAVDLEDGPGTVEASVPLAFDPAGKPLPPLNLEVHISPTALIGTGSGKGNTAAITGTITCDRATPVPVEIQLQVTEEVATGQAGGGEEGVASCGRNGPTFTATISSGRHAKTVFVPGSAGVILTAFADSGSSAEQTTTNDSITLKAPKS